MGTVPVYRFFSRHDGLNIGAILWFNKEEDTTSPCIPGLFSPVVFWCVFCCFFCFVHLFPFKKIRFGKKMPKKLVWIYQGLIAKATDIAEAPWRAIGVILSPFAFLGDFSFGSRVIGFHSFGCFWWFFAKRKSPFPQQIGPWRFLVGEVQTMPETIVKRWHPQRKGWSLNPQAFWKEYVYPADFSFLWFDGGNLSKTWAVSLEMSICFSWTVGCETPVLGCVVLAFWFGIWYVVSLKNPSQYGIGFGVDFTLNYPDVSENSPPHESNQVIHFCCSS